MSKLFNLMFVLFPLAAMAQNVPVIKGIDHQEGNIITHLKNGQALTAARMNLMMNAKKSIYVSAFSLSTDEVGRGLFEILCRKAKAGLDVRLILDHRNNKNYLPLTTKLKEECGVFAISFRPGDRIYALHEKILVVDGEKLITGGSGYSSKYLFSAPESFRPDSDLRKIRSEGWYDTDYLLEGPAACSMHNQFRNNFINTARQWADYNPDMHWYGPENFARMLPKLYGLGKFKTCASQKVRGDDRAISIHNNPHKTSKSHRPILAAHLAALDQTVKGEKIMLYAPYFVPGKAFVEALTRAAKRGVSIQVITNSIESTDEKKWGKKIFIGMMEALDAALEAGVKIYLWNQSSTLHRKGGAIGKVIFYGSDNLDNRAQEYQAEAVVYTDSVKIVEGVREDFIRDLKLSIPLTYEYVEKVYTDASFLDKLIGTKFKKYL